MPRMRRPLVSLLFAAILLVAVPATAFGHAERSSYFPDYKLGKKPKYRTTGKALVVCKADSGKRIRKQLHGKTRKRNLRLLKKCKFHNIQTAVNHAKSWYRILILPGVYKEEPSRKVSPDPPKCSDAKYFDENNEGKVANYLFHYTCPNARNLIAIMGDSPKDPDRRCDHRCHLQIEGTGTYARQVLIQGAGFTGKPGAKLNLIRADRADGFVLRNVKLLYSDFNNVYVLETNGFRLQKIETGYSREYGILSFTSDNGIYKGINAYGSGDSGVYPGSGPDAHCKRYGIEMVYINSHDNNLGTSGTAGNGTWIHRSKFHDNGTGTVVDSFAPNHPGMPQDCSKWENNEIYSNNKVLFDKAHDDYCKKPAGERNPRYVCSTFQNPVGTGALIAGGNGNIIRNNRIWNNWRYGTMLIHVPTALRGDDPTGQSQNDPNNQFDTSNHNAYTGNIMGIAPDGSRSPNGLDFWWSEEGFGNCWQNNATYHGQGIKSDPARLPSCAFGGSNAPGAGPFAVRKLASQATCSQWDPQTMTDPPGCDWMTEPKKPQ